MTHATAQDSQAPEGVPANAQPSPKLSVIVPFYGVEDYIAACLDSILANTFTDFEVICVDDGSLDGSLQVVRRYADADPRVRIVRQENQGLGPARNTGVRHARGAYLMFIDSDDLIAPRTFTKLVGTLEQTGSDFAVGNAWRFTRAGGVRPSWTHIEPCRTSRQRTNVREFPALVRDRMAWNKVYRASFWREHGYEFPAIRYEDYPITLKAHLDAHAVDIVSDRVYFWRDRESGESITQQTFNAANALERAASAQLVCDVLDAPGVPDDVRAATHAYFIDIDIVALAGALAEVGWHDRAALETAAIRLARRLDPQPAGTVPPVAALIHRALRDGDVDYARALVRFRSDRDPRALASEVRHRPASVPAALKAVMPRKKLPSLSNHRPLGVRMDGAVEEAGRFVVNVSVDVRQSLRLYVKVRAHLRVGERTIEVLAEPIRKWTGLEARIVITPENLRECAGQDAVLEVLTDRYALHWSGPVLANDPAELPAVLPMGDGTWAVGARFGAGAALVFRFLDAPLIAEGRKTGPTTAELRLSRSATLVVRRPDPTPDVVLPTGQVIELDAAALIAGDAPDEIVSGVAYRQITDADGNPVYCSRFPGAMDVDGTTVRIVPDAYGRAVARVTFPGRG